MVDPKLVKEWLIKAEEDFLFAEANLIESSEFHAQICFHFQQAAEKYLKAYIVAHNLKFEKQHDLVFLLKICAEKEPSLLSLAPQCQLLNVSYIDTRYPVHWPTNYSDLKTAQAREAALNVADTIKSHLNL